MTFEQTIALALVGTSGCVLGGGPVVALRKGRPALGWEVGGGSILLRADMGRTTAVAGPGSGKRVEYVSLTAQVPLAEFNSSDGTSTTPPKNQFPEFLWAGAALGVASAEGGRGLYANAFGSAVHIPRTSCSGDWPSLAATVALGVRWIGSAVELYVAPRADLFWNVCFR